MDLKLNLENDEALRVEHALAKNGQAVFDIDEVTRCFVRLDKYVPSPVKLDPFVEAKYIDSFKRSILDEVIDSGVGQNYEYTSFATTYPHIFIKTGTMITLIVCRSVFPMNIIKNKDDFEFTTKLNKNYKK
ncbi:hypothetical protein [Bacillus sp. SRB3LM]|uniref:hypothetical protein n=1 Tax=Bacillus sp. SRB3LM TaxID=2608689 RepID=UPI0018C35C69|nr:hypothetical protein [Bacillus sp. SRB3LM]MBG0967611.1 hypothetical protein [Bacillus sp. SRB3LM]